MSALAMKAVRWVKQRVGTWDSSKFPRGHKIIELVYRHRVIATGSTAAVTCFTYWKKADDVIGKMRSTGDSVQYLSEKKSLKEALFRDKEEERNQKAMKEIAALHTFLKEESNLKLMEEIAALHRFMKEWKDESQKEKVMASGGGDSRPFKRRRLQCQQKYSPPPFG